MSAETRVPINTVRNLQRGIQHGGERAFNLVPMHLKTVIERKEWEKCANKKGEAFKSFEEFVAYPLWWGLQSSIDELKAFCIKHDDVRRLIDGAVVAAAPHGTNQHSGGSNTTSLSSSGGRGSNYTLKRLKRDRPDLAEKVIAGELSANAAAVKAGFRHKPTPYLQILRLLSKLTDDERQHLRDELARRATA